MSRGLIAGSTEGEVRVSCRSVVEAGADGRGGVVDRELAGRSETMVGSRTSSGSVTSAALAAGVVAASSDECKEESSGFAMRSPPNDWDRLRSPSMMEVAMGLAIHQT